MVFYTWGQAQGEKFDPGFAGNVKWDIPLLDGYPHRFVTNTSRDPGTHHFAGIVNPVLNDEIEQWGPDAILIYGWNFNSHLKCIRHFRSKIPVLFRGDSTLLREQGPVKRIVRSLFLRWVYRHIDIALYAGESNKDYFKKFGLRDNQLVFMPHAVDNQKFSDPPAGITDYANVLRHELGIAANDKVILFAGKFEPIKNLERLIESFIKNKDQALK